MSGARPPAGTGPDLVDLAVAALAVAVAVAGVAWAGAWCAATLTGHAPPPLGVRRGVAAAGPPRRPRRRVGHPDARPAPLLGDHRRPRRTRGRVDGSRGPRVARPHQHPAGGSAAAARHRHRQSGDRRRRTARGDPPGRAHPPVAGQTQPQPGRLPPRQRTRAGGVGVGGGLDAAAGPAPLRQGPAPGHPRDPGRPRGGGDHLHPPGHPGRHPRRPREGRPGARVRPATARRRGARRDGLVPDPRLPPPADRDDPRPRPGRRHRDDPHPGRRGLLGRPNRNRATRAAARRRPGRPTTRGAVPVVAGPGRRHRRGQHPHPQPRRRARLGRRPGRRPTRRPPHPRLHLARRAPSPGRPGRPARAGRGHPHRRAGLRPRRVPRRTRHPVPAGHRRRRRRRRQPRGRPGGRHRRNRPAHRRRRPAGPARPAAAARLGRDRHPRPAAVSCRR